MAILAQIKTSRSSCPRQKYLNTFVLNQQKSITIYVSIKTKTIFPQVKTKYTTTRPNPVKIGQNRQNWFYNVIILCYIIRNKVQVIT